MADIDLKTETPDATLPSTGFLFGADSQAAASPSVYSTQAVATALLGSTSLTGATETTSKPLLDLSQTWNAGAVAFTGLKANFTDTASAAGSLLMDLQRGGVSQFRVGRTGATSIFTGIANAGVSTVILSGVSGTNDSRGGASLYSTFPTGADTAPRRIADIYAGFGDTTWNNAYINFGVSGSANDVANINPTAFQITRFGACVLNQLSFASTLANPATGDLFLRRAAAANLRLGAADAASPVAQTLSVQSVVAGTSNTAGANLTITGSQGTGTGAGGSIIFQVAPAGSSGTAQNALATALTIAGDRSVIVDNSFAIFSVNRNGVSKLATFDNTAVAQLSVASNWGIGWASSTAATGPNDVSLFRDAANTLALRNGTNAQGFRVYNTTDGTNSSYGSLGFFSNDFYVLNEKTGTGASGRIIIRSLGALRLGANSSAAWEFTTSNHLTCLTDNTHDIGASGATRPRSIFVGTSIRTPQINNNAGTIGIEGTTSSFPALKRSSTTLQVRLADDTANAPLESASVKTDAPAGGTSGTWKLGVAATVSPTSPNRTIEVDIGGTIYYIAAKTTND